MLLLRDPLNHIASRREGSKARAGQFRFDDAFFDVYADYCDEFLATTSRLSAKTVISFNRFVDDRSYCDEIAAALGVPNRDEVSEVSSHGDGSSFTGNAGPSSAASLMTRYRQPPLPYPILDGLPARPVIGKACRTVFGYDLAKPTGAR
jgi:hypothetical protein